MHFINVSTGLLLLNAFLSTTAIPVRPQAAVLEVRTLPVDTVGSQAKLAELQEMKTISQGPQAQANGFAPPEYWDGEIARVSKLLEIKRGLKTKRDLEVRTSRTVKKLKAILADIKRMKEESEKEGAKAELPPSYWDSQWNAVNRILEIVEGAKTPKIKRELEDRAAPVVISFEAALAKLEQAKIRSEQERSWPPPTYWARQIKHVEQRIAIHKSLKAGAPKTRDLEARGALLESPILVLKNIYNAQRKELTKIHIIVLEEKLAKLKLRDSLKETKGKSMSFKSNSWNRRVKKSRKQEIREIEEKLKNEKASYEKYWPSSPQPHKPDLEARRPPPGMAETAARLKDQLYFGTHSANKLSVSHFEKEIESLKAKAARLQSEGATSVSDRRALGITNIRIHTAEKGLAKARATEQSGPSSPHKRDLEARGPPLPVPGTAANRARLKEEFYAGTKSSHQLTIGLLEDMIAKLRGKVAELEGKPKRSWFRNLYLRYLRRRIRMAEKGLAKVRAHGPPHKRDLEARGPPLPVPGTAANMERLREEFYAGTKSAHQMIVGLLEHLIGELRLKVAGLEAKPTRYWYQDISLWFTKKRIVTAEKDLARLRAKEPSPSKEPSSSSHKRDLVARGPPLVPGTAASRERLREEFYTETKIAHVTALELLESEIARLKIQVANLQNKPAPSWLDRLWLRFRNAQLVTVENAIARLRAKGPSSPREPSSPKGPSSPEGPSSSHKRDLEARGAPVPGAAASSERLGEKLYFGTRTPYMAALDLLEGEVGRFKMQAATLENKAAPSWIERLSLKYWNQKVVTAEKALENFRAKGSSSHKQDIEARGAPAPGTAEDLARLSEEFCLGTSSAHMTSIALLEKRIANFKVQASHLQGKVSPSFSDQLLLSSTNRQIQTAEKAILRLREEGASSPKGASSPHKRDLEARASVLSPDQAARLATAIKSLQASSNKLAANRNRVPALAAPLKSLDTSLQKLHKSLLNLETKAGENVALQPVSKKPPFFPPQKRDLEARASGLSPDLAARLAKAIKSLDESSEKLAANRHGVPPSLASPLNSLEENLSKLRTSLHNLQTKAGGKDAALQPVSKPVLRQKRDLEARASILSPDQAARLATAIKSLDASSRKLAANRNRVASLAPPIKSLEENLSKLRTSLHNLQTKAGGKDAALQPVSKKPPVLPPQKRDLEARGAPQPQNVLDSLMATLKFVQKVPIKVEIALLKQIIASSKADLARARLPPPPKGGPDRNLARAELRRLENALANQEAKLAKMSGSPPHKRGLEARGPTPAEVKAAKENLNAVLDRISVTLDKFEIGIIEGNLANNKARVSQLQSELKNKKILSSSERSDLKTLSKDIKTQEGMLKKLRKQPHKRSLDKKTPSLRELEEKLAQAKIEVAQYKAQAKLPGASRETRELANIATLGLTFQQAKIARLRAKPHKRSLEERSLPLHVLEEELAKAKIEVALYKDQAKLHPASKEARQLASLATLGLTLKEIKIARLRAKPHKGSLEERSLPLLKGQLNIHLLDLESMRTTSLNRGQVDAVKDFDEKIWIVKGFLDGSIKKPPTPKGLKPPKASKAEKGKAKGKAEAEASTSSSKR